MPYQHDEGLHFPGNSWRRCLGGQATGDKSLSSGHWLYLSLLSTAVHPLVCLLDTWGLGGIGYSVSNDSGGQDARARIAHWLTLLSCPCAHTKLRPLATHVRPHSVLVTQ